MNALVRKDISTLDEGLVAESEVNKVSQKVRVKVALKPNLKITKTYRQRKGLSPR